jgi:hypothetical protein
LTPLLICHGHWSYQRTSKLILYSFYKNAAIALTSIWFAFFSAFSAQLFYDAYAGSIYNIIFTSLPIMLIAVFDRDVSRENLVRFPALYGEGLRNECFNVKQLVRVVAEGFAHSLLLYFGSHMLFTGAGDVMNSSGQSADLWVLSTSMYSFLIIVVTARVALDTSTFTWLNYFFLIASVLAWFGFALMYSSFLSLTPDMYHVAHEMMSTPAFWLGLAVVPAMCLVPELAWMIIRTTFWPTLKDVVMELERGYGSASARGRALMHVATAARGGHTGDADTMPSGVVVVRAAGAAPSSPRLGHLQSTPSKHNHMKSSSSRLLHSPAGATSSGLGSRVTDDLTLPAAASRNGLFPSALSIPLGSNSSSNVSSPGPSPMFSGVSNASGSPQPQPMVRIQRAMSVSQKSVAPQSTTYHHGPHQTVKLHLPPHNHNGEFTHNTPPVSARRNSWLQGGTTNTAPGQSSGHAHTHAHPPPPGASVSPTPSSSPSPAPIGSATSGAGTNAPTLGEKRRTPGSSNAIMATRDMAH